MTRLCFLLKAQNEYAIQSPYLYRLYRTLLAPRLDRPTLLRAGLSRRDRCGQLRYKFADHFTACWNGDRLVLPDGSLLFLVEHPHGCRDTEQRWNLLVNDPSVTLSVDLFYAGLAFTSKRLSKQHFLLS